MQLQPFLSQPNFDYRPEARALSAAASTMATSSSFEFSYQTSGGDVLTFSMSHENRLSSSLNSVEWSRSQSFQLRYEGDGLSEAEQAEIEAAFKAAEPLMQNYFEQTAASDRLASEGMRQETARLIGDAIAPGGNGGGSVLKPAAFDSIMKALETLDAVNETVVHDAARLFESLFEPQQGFWAYA